MRSAMLGFFVLLPGCGIFDPAPPGGAGYGLFIGLNSVDPNHYVDGNGRPWDGRLAGCENDADALARLVEAQGFATVKKLKSSQATRQAVIAELTALSQTLKAEDLLVVGYSGHGGQIPDLNGDEKRPDEAASDGMDETWCLFDGELLDDELGQIWRRFAPGVRIFVLSDSCHSGTVAKARLFRELSARAATVGPAAAALGPIRRVRAMPPDGATGTFEKHKTRYTSIAAGVSAEDSRFEGASASVLLLSACQDNQFAEDGDVNGKFTECLLQVWRDGRFRGNHRSFHESILNISPDTQSPNLYPPGDEYGKFKDMRPFKR